MESFKNPKVKSEFESHLQRDMLFLVPICRDVNFHCGFLTVPKVLEKVKRGKTKRQWRLLYYTCILLPITHDHVVQLEKISYQQGKMGSVSFNTQYFLYFHSFSLNQVMHSHCITQRLNFSDLLSISPHLVQLCRNHHQGVVHHYKIQACTIQFTTKDNHQREPNAYLQHT